MGAELASRCAGSALGWAWCPRPLRAHRRAISEAWRRASAPSLATDPGPSDCGVSPAPESLAPDICAKQSTVSRPPQVNWGVSACNTHNEVSIALAKFNYRSICFLIFPRWLDVFFFSPQLQRDRLHSSPLQKSKRFWLLFPDSSFEICQKP